MLLCVYSAAAAEAVTAYSKKNNEGDDNEPYYLILKKIAEAVHINFLSFIIMEVGVLSLSTIMICKRSKSVIDRKQRSSGQLIESGNHR